MSTYYETRIQLGRRAYGRLATAAAELLLEGGLAQLGHPSADLASAIREAAAQREG